VYHKNPDNNCTCKCVLSRLIRDRFFKMMAGILLGIRHTARMGAQALFAATLTTPARHQYSVRLAILDQ
jgi:hypothetical protein